MTDAEREQRDRDRQAYRKVRQAPGVQAARLTELLRQLDEDDLNASQRTMKEHAVESLERAFRAQVRCRICGRHLENETSRGRGIGPECERKVA
jgi:DNA repair exonuclease SbcCD ATPase subunit